ncbi:CinA family nicotinamide mononucleotide deamidase-related protein [Deferribacteraceae bacterium V6Fe1]|nr:CinA family nicotinamide mononucleotide deamidase-related protein [Deferribacteraceae bacterium V6Fe1]
MVNCTIFAIGNELLEGSIVDTNSSYIARSLSALGVSVNRVSMLRDNIDEIIHAFKDAEKDSQIIITTGGLGPTFDDLTAEASAKAFGYKLVLNETALSHIIGMLSKRGVNIKESHKRQAMLPENCLLFDNKVGTALGFGVKTKKGFCISLPGIPYEMKYILDNSVLKFIKENFNLKEIFREDLKFKGLPESDVDEVIRESDIPEGVECIINVSKGEIIVRLRSFNREKLDYVKKQIIEKLKDNFFGFERDSLEGVLLNKLKEKGLKIATAESCTGGLVAKKITDIPGSSASFVGSVVAYSNDVKVNLLAVPSETIEMFGAASAECASAMLFGLNRLFGNDIGIAVTGVAGPDGGTKDKPVGLVYVGVDFKGKCEVKRFEFNGDRETIRERSAKAALSMVIDMIK